MAESIKMVGHKTYPSKTNVVSQSKKEQQAQKFLENTTKVTGEQYEVSMLWSEPEPNLSNNYGSAIDIEKEFVKILNTSEAKGFFGREWYLPHHPVLNPIKPGRIRLVCYAAAKYKEVCLNDKLLAAADPLHGLIGKIFRFREGPKALTADIESVFLQVQVLEPDKSCLRFL
ncbi:uncharacterized protein LOC142352899 [Convolutriloba macropyga]|uniref:uncharacterized protein LOC142352899 n=1 Tax=Convolutriloba macropyga TaxID=536237 RepID=UPI003F51D9F4